MEASSKRQKILSKSKVLQRGDDMIYGLDDKRIEELTKYFNAILLEENLKRRVRARPDGSDLKKIEIVEERKKILWRLN